MINQGSDTLALEIDGSEPVGYIGNAEANAVVTTDLSGSATNVADLSGTLLISSVQNADASADSGAQTVSSQTFIDITTTLDADVTGTATLDGNAVTSAFTANTRDASIGLAADDASSLVTAAISNAQTFDANDADIAALTAGNQVRANIAVAGEGGATTSFVDSSLSVASNTISASANGNTASTQTSLADGLAYDTVAANTASASIDELTGDPVLKSADVTASGGLVGVNTQIVTSGTLTASLDSNNVDVDVASPENSSIDVSSNRLTAAATGNDLTAGIASGDSSAVFDASAVLASRQELNSADVRADSDDNDVTIDVGNAGEDATFVDSTITVDSNVLAASAVGNRARQTIDLEATSLNAGTDSAAVLSTDLNPVADGDQAVSAAGAVVIASTMTNIDSDVSASNTASDIDVDTYDTLSGEAANTSVLVTNNVQQAFAAGSDAGNALSLTGVNVGSGAGIANLQTNDATSTVSASQDSSIDVDYAGDLVSGSSEISANNASAIARGTVAANTLAVDAQILALGDNGTVTDTDPTALDVSAAASFGVVNVQEVLADVTAISQPDDTNVFRMDVNDGLTDANTVVNANTVMGQAQGTVATNAVSLDVGTLTSVDSSGDAAIANLQNVAGADILATVNGDENGAIVETEIDLAVLRSSVETSNNRVMTSAESARASNVLSVSGTSLSGDALSAYAYAYPDADYNQVAAQFGVSNTQVAGTGNVTASLREGSEDGFTSSSAVITDLGSTVTSSEIESNGNLLQALASSNRATNAVNVDGTTLDQVTSGLANAQVSEQSVSALIGFEGTAATEGTPSTAVNKSGTGTLLTADLSTSGTNVTNNGGAALDFTVASLSADEATFLSNLGFVGATTGSTTISIAAGNTVDFGSFVGFDTIATDGDTDITFTGFTIPGTAGSAGTFNAGGVVVDVEGAIDASTIAVNGNAVQGSAIGNTASNSVTVASTTADGVQALAGSDVFTDATGQPEARSDADASLASTQILESGSSSTTDLFTTFAIDGALDTAITDSALSVADNSAYGEAIGNTVTNSLTVAGTDLAGTATSGALASSQDGISASITAGSDMEVAANVVSSDSNVAMDRNTNSALGVVNNATNTLIASSTNSTSSAQAVADSDVVNGDNATGDGSFALVSGQQSSGTLTTTATTSVYNIGSTDTTTTGVVNGSVSMSDNATRSESTANRAANTLSLNADANLGSTGALLNQQASSTTTVANATSNVAFGVAGTTPTTGSLNTSSVSVEGNTTLALARGNSASNTLNYTAGASYTATDGAATVNGDTNLAQASAALLNDQENTGAVNANAAGGTSIALNATNVSTDAGVLNANVSNSNNSTTAFAVGNTAANTVMLSSLTTGMPNVALGNQQTNSGAVTASATSVTYSMSSIGTVGASMFQNNGNAASATAIGNSSVSVIGAR